MMDVLPLPPILSTVLAAGSMALLAPGCSTTAPERDDPAWHPPMKTVGAVYGAHLDYGRSTYRSTGWAATAYGAVSDGRQNAVELAVGETSIDYTGLPDLRETSYTAVYNRFQAFPDAFAMRAGVHYTESTDDFTDRGKTLFGDCTYSQPWLWNAGLEAAYTRFDGSADELDVVQLAPHGGLFLWKLESWGSLYAESRLFYIRKDADLAWDDSRFLSFEQSLSYLHPRFDLSLTAWGGEQLFALKERGFVLYTAPDLYKGGWQVELGHSLGVGLRAALRAGQNRFEEPLTSDRIWQTVFVLSVSASF